MQSFGNSMTNVDHFSPSLHLSLQVSVRVCVRACTHARLRVRMSGNILVCSGVRVPKRVCARARE
jgi:hypothetical protein